MIEESIQLGDPIEHRGIVIAPLYPRNNPKAQYLTLEEALPLGFQITEIDDAGSVPELLAVNPLDHAVLLYDGEELLGAKQNRILNVTVLVAAKSETRIPVSCVEQGRWHARSGSFDAARHAAYPDLRRRKAEQLSAEPLARGAAQAAVWDEVAAKAGRHGVDSPTGAAADIYRGRDARTCRASARVPALAWAVRCGARARRRSALPGLRVAPGRVRAALSEAARRLPARRARAAQRETRRPREACGVRRPPSESLHSDARHPRVSETTSASPVRASLAQGSTWTRRFSNSRLSRATAAARGRGSRDQVGAAEATDRSSPPPSSPASARAKHSACAGKTSTSAPA